MTDEAGVDGFHWTTETWGEALRSRPLGAEARHFFTSLPLKLRGRTDEEERDWELVARTIGVPADRLLRLRQVHGHSVVVARRGEAPGEWPDAAPAADIVVADDPEIALAVQVADCAPLLVADARTGAVAAAHAGWRGTVQNVAAAAVAALAREFGSRPSDLVAVVGPSIGPCCYVVGDELPGEFRKAGFGDRLGRWFSSGSDGRLRLDLWAANRDELAGAGARPDRIHVARLCTACHPGVFPSYRRDGSGTGRIAATIRAGR